MHIFHALLRTFILLTVERTNRYNGNFGQRKDCMSAQWVERLWNCRVGCWSSCSSVRLYLHRSLVCSFALLWKRTRQIHTVSTQCGAVRAATRSWFALEEAVKNNCKGGSMIQQTKQDNAGVDRSEKGKDSRADGKYHSKTKSTMMWRLAENFFGRLTIGWPGFLGQTIEKVNLLVMKYQKWPTASRLWKWNVFQ